MDRQAVITGPAQPPAVVGTGAASASATVGMREAEPWRLSPRSIAVRLFLTCWIVYGLHFATDVVREHYLAIAIAEDLSFRVDPYGGLHPDLFETPGRGWHIGNNPGGSMLAAIPYAPFAPVVNAIAERVQARRAAAGLEEPPAFDTPRPNARIFYAEAWRRGMDIKLGLAAWIMHALCMAPLSALAAVVMFYALRQVLGSDRTALWLSLLFAFGTPVFFRTGFLNHNVALGYIAFMGFLTMWNPADSPRWSSRRRYFLGGISGGTALLFDYSGAVFLLGLFVYGILKRLQVADREDAFRHAVQYFLGTLPAVFLLWFYQWASFGNPFLPGQHWMPPVEWIDQGYQGFGLPQLELFTRLGFDLRYGLFLAAPVLALALLGPLLRKPEGVRLPRLEELFLVGLFFALWLFFSGNNYTRLQFNTGIRYMTPIIPFLFVPAAAVLARLRPVPLYLVSVFSVLMAWSTAMNREVWGALGVFDPVVSVLSSGLQLPALTTLSRTAGQYGPYFERGVSPLPLFLLAGAIIYALWSPRFAGRAAPARR